MENYVYTETSLNTCKRLVLEESAELCEIFDSHNGTTKILQTMAKIYDPYDDLRLMEGGFNFPLETLENGKRYKIDWVRHRKSRKPDQIGVRIIRSFNETRTIEVEIRFNASRQLQISLSYEDEKEGKDLEKNSLKKFWKWQQKRNREIFLNMTGEHYFRRLEEIDEEEIEERNLGTVGEPLPSFDHN